MPNLTQKIQVSNKHFTDFFGAPNSLYIYFTPILVSKILEIINGLKNKRSTGHGEIRQGLHNRQNYYQEQVCFLHCPGGKAMLGAFMSSKVIQQHAFLV